MLLATLLGIGLSLSGIGEYTRPLDAGKLDQATLDAEGYGDKDAFRREDDGLRITLAPGAAETGWKTPPQLRVGGNFTITAEFVLHTLPKPAQEDGVGVGLAIATQNADQPDATLVRLTEPDGSDVYRTVDQPKHAPQPQPMMMPMPPFPQPGVRPPKPPRPTFPAEGEAFRLEMRREGDTVRYQVIDAAAERSRYLGQVALGSGDLMAIKLFATNRNGAEAVDVVLRALTIRADRLNGLGTAVQTVFGDVIYGEPIAIEDDVLMIGAPSQASEGQAPPQPGASSTPPPAAVPAIAPEMVPAPVAGIAAPAVVEVLVEDFTIVAVQPAGAPIGRDGEPEPPDDSPPAERPPEGSDAGAELPKPEPKATIPLDELAVIRFERTPALAGRFLGQPNIDVTGPHPSAKSDETTPDDGADDQGGSRPEADDLLAPPPGTAASAVEKVPRAEPEPNGIRDLHLILSGLRDAEITQLTVTCQTDDGPANWRLDTTDSRDGPLVLRRAGQDAWADLFLEPPAGDCHQKAFQIQVTYADGQAANATVPAGDHHTDPERALDPDEPTPPEFDARVFLVGHQQLFGKLERLDEDSLRITTPWQDTIEVPLDRVAGIHIGLPDRKESPDSFAVRLKDRGTEDLLLARTRDGEIVAIAGIAEGTEGDRLRFLYQGESRTVPLRMVEGLVLADRPAPTDVDGLLASFVLSGGLLVSGTWNVIEADSWKVETPWGASLNLPAAEVQSVRFRGGQMTYLSDLDPVRVEETPFFGRRMPWRRDVNLQGGPLTMNGQPYERGLAVHSRCELSYDLDGRFATFETLVGFDDEARGLGRVDCRVFADDEELYANPDLRADEPPVALSLPVSGAQTLRLLIDFGPGQDTGDRVIWANARLYRRPPPEGRPAPTDSEPDDSR